MTKRAGRHNKSPRKRRRSREYHHGCNVIVQRVTERIVGSSAIATGQTTSGNAEELGEEKDSFFWPELNQSTVEAAFAAGRGECVKSLQYVRIELEAIKKNYNIPDSVKARMVFEAGKMMVYSKVVKEKVWAIRLLKAMDDSNHRPRVLPAQITVNNKNTLTVNALLEEFGKDLMDPSMDLREVRAIPGSPDDYAD
ncbi:MAG: hypothetical protein NTY42_10650 [Planctomycetota bacterium]|nr:hypothetical protein [Planctomycetota bacterium]